MPVSLKSLIAPTVLSIVLTYFFYSLNAGITITNDGSHFALFDSIVSTGSPELKNVKQFAAGDSALYDEKYYSDRNPGLALFTVALYQGIRFIEPWTKPMRLDPKYLKVYNEPQAKKIRIVMLVPAVSGGLVFFLTFLLARRMDCGYIAALACALSLVLGTILIRYSTVFYSHALAGTLLLAGLLSLFSFRWSGGTGRVAAGIFLLSSAVLVEHIIILVFLPVTAYLFYTKASELLRPRVMISVTLAGLLPMSVLMGYNYICFDSPFSIAHFHHSHDKANYELSTLLRFDRVFTVTQHLLFGATKAEVGGRDLLGLFDGSPFLYFLMLYPWLLVTGYRQFAAEHLTLIVCIILLVLGAASVWEPYGGWDRDYRYFVVVAPLFAPFLGSVLDFLATRDDKKVVNLTRYATLLLFTWLCYLSIRTQLGHIRHEEQFQAPSIFINTGPALVNVSLFLGLVATIVALVLFINHLRRPARGDHGSPTVL